MEATLTQHVSSQIAHILNFSNLFGLTHYNINITIFSQLYNQLFNIYDLFY
jgi:hypothetical protein